MIHRWFVLPSFLPLPALLLSQLDVMEFCFPPTLWISVGSVRGTAAAAAGLLETSAVGPWLWVSLSLQCPMLSIHTILKLNLTLYLIYTLSLGPVRKIFSVKCTTLNVKRLNKKSMMWRSPLSVFWCQGYSFITQIPEGSWDIQIIERKKSADVLGGYLLSSGSSHT